MAAQRVVWPQHHQHNTTKFKPLRHRCSRQFLWSSRATQQPAHLFPVTKAAHRARLYKGIPMAMHAGAGTSGARHQRPAAAGASKDSSNMLWMGEDKEYSPDVDASSSNIRFYIDNIMERIRDQYSDLQSHVPAKAYENMDRSLREKIQKYIKRLRTLKQAGAEADTLVKHMSSHERGTCLHRVLTSQKLALHKLEVDEEVRQFVQTLKDWSLKLLKQEGRVLLGMHAYDAGNYYDMEQLCFILPKDADEHNANRVNRNNERPLPPHQLTQGETITVVEGSCNPLDASRFDLYTGIIVEKGTNFIKVAFKSAPDAASGPFRLDKAVNTITYERALEAMEALWHTPDNQDFSFGATPSGTTRSSDNNNSSCGILNSCMKHVSSLFSSAINSTDDDSDSDADSDDSDEDDCRGPGSEVFSGSVLRNVLLLDKGDRFSLPADLQQLGPRQAMTEPAVAWAQGILPRGVADPVRIKQHIKKLEAAQGRQSGTSGRLRLDPSQLTALATVILNPVALLHGPPGTGKTTTITALTYYLRREFGFKGTALAVAQSNVAVDNMLEGAMRRAGLKVVRIGEPVRVRGALRGRTLRVLADQQARKDPEMSALQEEREDIMQQLKSAREEARREVRRGMTSSQYRHIRSLEERQRQIRPKRERRLRGIELELLAEADLVGATSTGSGGSELRGVKFDLVIMDEGSQCSEPEALVPLMKGARRLVLVGDNKQLPPVVHSQAAQQGGLDLSLFERLMDMGTPSAVLQVTYRMHPALAHFPNTTFYGGLLADGVKAADRPTPQFPFPQPDVPMIFLHVSGSGERQSVKGSKSNADEAKLLVTCLLLLHSKGLLLSDIGVITPYAAQVHVIADQLAKVGVKTNSKVLQEEQVGVVAQEVEVKSVDGYQGREKEVILLSTVRSNRQQLVGFLSDWRRMNVGLTRARRAIIVVGDRNTLKADPYWTAYMKWQADMGCLIEAETWVKKLGKQGQLAVQGASGGGRRGGGQKRGGKKSS